MRNIPGGVILLCTMLKMGLKYQSQYKYNLIVMIITMTEIGLGLTDTNLTEAFASH